jgi:hypothetical protein
MNVTSSNRKRALVLLVAVALLAPASVLLADDWGLFIGAGYASQPESAIYSAIEDAEGCAASVGLYSCTMVGEPEIFIGTGHNGGIRYTAQVKLDCN